MPVFKTGAFNRSATPPRVEKRAADISRTRPKKPLSVWFLVWTDLGEPLGETINQTTQHNPRARHV
jgi:hypothetical protein